jgi:hypothetical protein
MEFNNDAPSYAWNTAKMLLTFGTQVGWGKDYWEIEVVFEQQ